MKRTELLLTLTSIILGILGIVFIDFGRFLDLIASAVRVDLGQINFTRAWLELFFGISIILALVLLIVLLDALLSNRKLLWHSSEKFYDGHEIVDYIKKYNRPIKNVTVFGYSLSFAEPLRIHLNTVNNPDLMVNIIVADFQFIDQFCIEDKDIKSRIEYLRGRLQQWCNLYTLNHVREIKVYAHVKPP